MTSSRRETLLSIAFAAWGLAVAIALAGFWTRPAPSGQLPSLATRLNFDAHGPFRWIAGMMLLPFVFALVLRPLAPRVRQFWPAFAAPFVTLWFVTINRDVLWSLVPCAIIVALATFVTPRSDRPARYRDEVLLVPAFLAALLAVIDVLPSLAIEKCVLVAALLVLVLRQLIPPRAFVLAPLAMVLQTGFFARDQRYSGWIPLAIVVITPVVLRFLPRIDRRWIVVAVYPLTLWAYVYATTTTTAEGKGRVNFFEDSHALLPAGEYLRGELPFRDVMPLHGLIEDGLFDYVAMKISGPTVGSAVRARFVAGGLNLIALYALAFAVTASAEGAFLAVLLAIMMGNFTFAIRLLPSLTALALIAGAVRWRKPRLFAYAGLMTVVCGLTSVDFAFFTFVTFAFAVLRQRERGAAMRHAAIGIAAGVIPMSLAFLAFGIFDDFVRMTFGETLQLGPLYVLNIFTPSPSIERTPTFPDVLVSLLDRGTFPYVFWCLATLFFGVAVLRRRPRRIEPLVMLSLWVVLTAISFAERHHLYFVMVMSTFVVTIIVALLRAGRRDLAAIAIVAAIVLSAPTTHVAIVGWLRHARGPLEPHWVEVPEVPRARGALFTTDDAQTIRGVAKYVSLALGPDETFFDFSNRGILYFLFRRDSPIREYEVANYQTEERQREVIRRLEENPNVRAVLVTGPLNRYIVDGVLNQERAPLVWQYIETHFQPDFQEGDVVFWRRK